MTTIAVAREDTMLLRVEEAAHELRLSRAMVYQLIARGSLPVIRIGKATRVSRAALQRWIESQSWAPVT